LGEAFGEDFGEDVDDDLGAVVLTGVLGAAGLVFLAALFLVLDRALRFAEDFAAVFGLAAGLARAFVFFFRLTFDVRAAALTGAFFDADFFVLVFLRFALDAMLALPVMDSGWGVKRPPLRVGVINAHGLSGQAVRSCGSLRTRV
jgi:hypothetical protein